MRFRREILAKSAWWACFSFACLVPAVLAIFYARSYFIYDYPNRYSAVDTFIREPSRSMSGISGYVDLVHRSWTIGLQSVHGSLAFHWREEEFEFSLYECPKPVTSWKWYRLPAREIAVPSHGGFQLDIHKRPLGALAGSSTQYGNYILTLGVPYWVLLLLSIIPVLLLRPGRRCEQRHRKTAGLCLSCGYDLRASMERCPECGSAFT